MAEDSYLLDYLLVICFLSGVVDSCNAKKECSPRNKGSLEFSGVLDMFCFT